ncbi:MAG: tRNA (adenosine(37)-N6)-threonylcarbamoyltransferase complex dimerization subunit type 1 TsaB, partial [Nonlabens sp.]
MALILCVETTSTNCSVALASDNGGFNNQYGIVHCLDLLEDNSDGYSHGERLHIYINEILTRNNITANDLDGIAVSEGPGSYTGLRIGVATVKGLCYALGIPMMAVSTLESLSKQNTSSNISIAMLDARRMEVYAAIFDGTEQLESPAAVILDQESFSRFRESGTVTFIGTGITKFEDLIKEEQHTYTTSNPTALTLCDLAMDKYKKSDTVDVAYFEP